MNTPVLKLVYAPLPVMEVSILFTWYTFGPLGAVESINWLASSGLAEILMKRDAEFISEPADRYTKYRAPETALQLIVTFPLD